MAKAVVAAEIKVESKQAEQSVGNIRTRIKEAKEELISAIENFGEFSKEAANAAKKVEGLKGTMDDASRLVNNFDGDRKFQAFGAAVGAVAGGFSAAQGAMGLLGIKSKETEEALLKVQSAMALSQGLNSVLEGIKHFKDLGTIIKSTTVFQKSYNAATVAATAIQKLFGVSVVGTGTAFKVLRAAIIATGIGLLISLLAVAADKMGIFADATQDAADAMTEQIEAAEKLVDSLEAIAKASENARAAQSKGTDEMRRQLNLLRSRGASAREVFDKEQEIRQMELKELRILGNTYVSLYNQRKEAGTLTEALVNEINNRVADINKKGLDKANEIEAAKLSFIKQNNDKIAEEKNKAAQKNEAAEEKNKEHQKKLNDFNRESQQEFRRQINKDIEDDRAAYLAAQEHSLEEDKKMAEARANISIENWDRMDKVRQEDIEREQLAAQKKAEILNFTISIAQQAADIIGRQTVAGKALAIAGATIDTYRAANSALKADYGIFGPAAQIARFAAVALTIARGIKNIKEIAKVKVPGGVGGGSGPVPSIEPPLMPQASTTTINQNQINQIGNATSRAYVLETDVSGNQERQRRLNRAARIN